MRPRAPLPPLSPGQALVALGLVVLTACAASELSQAVVVSAPSGVRLPGAGAGAAAGADKASAAATEPATDPSSLGDTAMATSAASAAASAESATPLANEPADAAPVDAASAAEPTDSPAPVHCGDAPQLQADGSVPPAPPHDPLGFDVDVPDDRPVYVLPGNPGDPRVIIYLHGMCGDVTAADYFREAVRAHGTLLALRGDTPCGNGRFKWRDDASKIQTRIRAAFKRVNAHEGGELKIQTALLFGYSQGADRAEKVAARFPKLYPRIVLGGTPVKASPTKLAQAERVAFLGGELETTGTMHAGHDALAAAGISTRFFTLDCAYHGYFGSNAETQLTEVLDWVTAPRQ